MGIAEDIDQLENRIASLKVGYEQYFMRLVKREPLKLREEVDRLILQYSMKKITNTSLQFRYNSIVAKYSSYKQYWTRVLRAIEEGTYQREAQGARPASAAQQPPGSETSRKAGEEPLAAPAAGAAANGGLAEVYRKYIEAKTACNEPTEGLTYDAFVKSVEKSKQKALEIYKTDDIEVKVSVKDGKAKLALTPKAKQGG